MNVKQIVITIMVILPISVGCQHYSSFYLSERTDRPVMLGKIEGIGGKTREQGVKASDFNLYHQVGKGWLMVGNGANQWQISDDLDADEELKKKLVSSYDSIKIDQIDFSSSYHCLLFILINSCISQGSTGIQGAIYSGIER